VLIWAVYVFDCNARHLNADLFIIIFISSLALTWLYYSSLISIQETSCVIYSSSQNSCFMVLKCLQPSHSDFLYAKMITRHFTLVP
jgi:hypothetical protein